MKDLTTASIFVGKSNPKAELIKRLALLFDRVQLVFPSWTLLSDEMLNDPNRTQRADDGSITLVNFNYFKDTYRGLVPDQRSLSAEQQEVLLPFKEAGIVAFTSEIEILPHEEAPEFETIKNLLMSCDIQDAEFNRLSGTNPDVYRAERLDITPITIKSTDDGTQYDLIILNEPTAVSDSHQLTMNLLCSELHGTLPVFPALRHRRELEHRYEQYKAGLQLFKEYHPSDFNQEALNASFGEVAFFVGSRVFSDELLRNKSAKEIIKYRDAMADSRQRYVSQDLLELAHLVEDAPWCEDTKSKVEDYINRKLTRSIQDYENFSVDAGEKLFGSLAVRATEAAKSAAVTATAGGVLGSVLPFVSPWLMLSLCALAGAAKESPRIVKDIVDYVIEVRKLKRSSVAYVSHFLQKK